MGALFSLWAALLRGVKQCFRACPDWLRYPVTILLWWPTLLYNRVYCALLPHKRRKWDLVNLPGRPGHGSVWLGSVPLFASEVADLHAKGVRGVVNLCKEWDSHAEDGGAYARLGIKRHYAPTIDFSAPSLSHTLAAAAFIDACVRRGESVLVHCKAGRGRSVCVVLAYLTLHHGFTPRAADAHVRQFRPHISKKWHLPLLQAVHALAEERAKGGGADSSEAAAAGTVDSSGSAAAPAAAHGSEGRGVQAAADATSRTHRGLTLRAAQQGAGTGTGTAAGVGGQAAPRSSSSESGSARSLSGGTAAEPPAS